VETNDVGKEGLSHRLRGVGVRQRYEVAVLAEAVHDGQDDRLAVHPRERLHEVDADVRPDDGGNGVEAAGAP